jgi:hypothetical protein
MDLQVYFMDERQCIGLWQNIALVDIAGRTDSAGMRAIGDAYKQLARTHASVAGFVVVRATALLPSAETNQEAASFAKQLGPTLAHVAVVIEAQGVLAQLFRSGLRAFGVLSRRPPLSVNGTVLEGARELAPFVQSKLPPPQVAQQLSEAFGRLRTGYTKAG